MPAGAGGGVRNDSVNIRVADRQAAQAVFAYANQMGYVRVI
jgi:hypothetical protein